MTNWEMYWLLRLDTVVGVFEILAVVGVTAAIILIAAYCLCKWNDDDAAQAFRRPAQIVGCLAVFFVLGTTLTPTTNQMAAIIVVPKIVNNKEVQELPQNIIDLANSWIGEKTKNLKEVSK